MGPIIRVYWRGKCAGGGDSYLISASWKGSSSRNEASTFHIRDREFRLVPRAQPESYYSTSADKWYAMCEYEGA